MITALKYTLTVMLLAGSTHLSRKAFFKLAVVFFKFRTVAISLYSLLYFPGTVIHEMSHFFMASLLGVRTGEITLFPDIKKDSRIRMGSVQIAKTDFIRSSLIGVAPFITGNILLLFFTSLITNNSQYSLYSNITSPNASMDPIFLLILYGILTISNTLFTSKEDRRHWPVFVVIFLLVIVTLFFLDVSISLPQSIVEKITGQVDLLSLSFLVASGINLVLFAVLQIPLKIRSTLARRY